MAKAQSFADKVNKARLAGAKTCPICGEIYSHIKKVEPVLKNNGKFGYNETIVRYCKCSEKEIFGV